MTLLCVPLTGWRPDRMRAQMARAFAAGADIVELRLDMLAELDAEAIVRELVGDKGGPVIATCRLTAEGGHFDGPESERISVLERVGLAGAEYVDCEFAAWSSSANIRQKIALVTEVNADSSRGRGKLILSAHDFEKTPADLEALFDSIAAEPCHVAKVACTAETIADNLRMFDALRETAKRKPAIGLCMGQAGVMSRVLAKKAGAWLTFASLEAGAESAPGQVTLDEVKRLYRWDAQNEETAVYGVIGNPVGHSMSPAIHNAAFAACKINAVYLPFLVESAYEHFAAFVDGCRRRAWLGLGGCSVTIPHKFNALRYVGENVEALARKIGSVNTLIIEDGGVRGINTDYAGAFDAITDALGCEREDIKGNRVAVLGAGGASRAIVAALCHYGAAVTVYNRTFEKARRLAEEFGCKAAAWDERSKLDAELVINTTSIGMHPNVEESPLEADGLRASMTVFDMVYNPIETKLLTDAKSAGCRTIDGVTMFVNQAVAQFEAWTGAEAPVEVMREVVVIRLGM